MQVNNETPVLDDILPFEDNQEDIIMDEPLDDDLCNASMMASSIMEDARVKVEVFGRECAEKGPRVGLIFETKQMLIEQLSEWAIKCLDLTKLLSLVHMSIRFDVILMRNVVGGYMQVYRKRVQKIGGKSKDMEEIILV